MSRDPLELLFESLDRTRHLNDAQVDQMVPTTRLLSQVDGAGRQSLTTSLTRRRFWRNGVVLSTAAVLVIGSVAAAITLSRRPVETVAHMTCYRGDSLKSTGDVVSYDSNPLTICSQIMHWSSTSINGARGKGSLCLLSNGSLAAFPPSRKTTKCSALGLVAFNGKLAYPEVAKFQLAAESYFAHHICQSVNTASRKVLQLMGTYGLAKWKVRVTGSTSTNACATLAFQLNPMVADIVGAHRKSSPTTGS